MFKHSHQQTLVLVKYWHGGDFGTMQRHSAEQLCQQPLGFYIAEQALGKSALKH